jgi:hypothetical protein
MRIGEIVRSKRNGDVYHRFLQWEAVRYAAAQWDTVNYLTGEVVGDVRFDTPYFVEDKGKRVEKRGYVAGKVYVLRKQTNRKGE